MAISSQLGSTAQVSPIERVEAWTVSQAADALATTSISSALPVARSVRGQTVTIDIPLDEGVHPEAHSAPPRPRPEVVHTVYKRREPIRRDSQKRREALLKGKEGSRRRQRWENDRLLNNPYAQPPLPSDWEIHPQYPRHAEQIDAAKAPATKEEAAVKRVTQELRGKLKKSKGAKGLLQDLEREVRGFVEEWDTKQKQLECEGIIDPDSSEDDEIVFVGRNGTMSDEALQRKDEQHLAKDKLIFQSLVDDHGAAFGRYLVHSIAAYYGLQTWSVTTGDPARREAYVGFKLDPKTKRPDRATCKLPRPLWAVV
ncbi:R3H-associated N-terminal domain [Teratosphaeria destructans]|uniref:R3H-associated N-terminal domain n=1 Tax=Teratosphaeria destructans TaxID=418781 RepID=A0A9W7SIW9_9PEZI|nr:R3H-associated N-terminal domain [Teratosphaeria destructans]